MKKLSNERLLSDLRLLSGLSLTTGNQCKKLSEIIFNTTGYQISWQSLRRVLGFIKSESEPNILTLNIIGRFLGYDSYVSYENSKQPSSNHLKGSSLMDILEIVYSGSLQPEKDLNYHFVCSRISNYFYFHPHLLKAIPSRNFEASAFQEYFIGRFPLLDLLDHGFQEVLLNHAKVNNNEDAKLFVYSNIFLHNYRNNRVNMDWLERLSKDLDTTKSHPFLVGRYFGIQLHLDTNKGSQLRVFDKVESQLKNGDSFEQMCMLFTFIEFAIAAKLFASSLKLLDSFYPKPSDSNNWIEFGYYEVFKIFRFVCLVQLGSFEAAKTLKQQISINGIAFYFRKTFELMFLESSDLLEVNELDRARIKTLKMELYPNSV